jgi:acyl carrier protein
MTPVVFLKALSTILDRPDGSLTMETPLEGLPGWDSINIVTFIVFCDEKLAAIMQPPKILECKTVGDLYKLAMSSSKNSEPRIEKK